MCIVENYEEDFHCKTRFVNDEDDTLSHAF